MKLLQWAPLLVLSTLLAACLNPQNSQSNINDKDQDSFTKVASDYWQAQLRNDPMMAQSVGDRRYDKQLTDFSDKGFKLRADMYVNFKHRLDSLNLVNLSKQDLVSHRVLSWIVDHELQLLQSPWRYYQFNTYDGWHSSFAHQMSTSPLKSKSDYDNYLLRLQAFEKFGLQKIALLKEGVKVGHVQPCETLGGYLDSIKGYVKPVQKSPFYEPFLDIAIKITSEEKNQLQQRAGNIIENIVNPTYLYYADFFEQQYLPHCEKNIALATRPGGTDLYDFFVRYYTSTDMNAEQVHKLGLSEVARIRQEMVKIKDELEFSGSLTDFLQELRTNPVHYPKDKQSYLNYAAFLAKKVDGKLPGYFSYLPRNPYGIKEIPEQIAPKTSTAYYQHGASDGSRSGSYFINTYDLASRPLYELPALTLHESVPGHHLQISIQNEMTSLPDFRRYYYFHSFGEGWGLYSEYLGEEMGMYPTPYDRFGRLTYEMWRACRLVVDSGMHTKGWSRQQAIDYMAGNSALSLHNITTEVDRYISWPGQALAYKVGELKIRELRQYAESLLGEDFSLRDFHQQVLNNGAVPLSVLQQNIEEWVAIQL